MRILEHPAPSGASIVLGIMDDLESERGTGGKLAHGCVVSSENRRFGTGNTVDGFFGCENSKRSLAHRRRRSTDRSTTRVR